MSENEPNAQKDPASEMVSKALDDPEIQKKLAIKVFSGIPRLAKAIVAALGLGAVMSTGWLADRARSVERKLNDAHSHYKEIDAIKSRSDDLDGKLKKLEGSADNLQSRYEQLERNAKSDVRAAVVDATERLQTEIFQHLAVADKNKNAQFANLALSLEHRLSNHEDALVKFAQFDSTHGARIQEMTGEARQLAAQVSQLKGEYRELAQKGVSQRLYSIREGHPVSIPAWGVYVSAERIRASNVEHVRIGKLGDSAKAREYAALDYGQSATLSDKDFCVGVEFAPRAGMLSAPTVSVTRFPDAKGCESPVEEDLDRRLGASVKPENGG